MKLFLIRHGETEHNVAGLLAGVTDSILTNHGVLQAQRLGTFLAERNLHFGHIYASDLQRAYMTAGAIRDAQEKIWPGNACVVVKLKVLREQDFGSLECTPWASRREDGQTTSNPKQAKFVPKETDKAMTERAEAFLDDYISPLLVMAVDDENLVALVSHGLYLGVLWRSLIARFGPQSISLGPEVSSNTVGRPLQYLPAWVNTGFLELDIIPHDKNASAAQETNVVADPLVATIEAEDRSKVLADWKMVIRAVNAKEHLNNLKRTRGGVGSATFDAKQKSLDGFLKKTKTVIGSDV